jgi:hypothetical protein
MSKPTRPQPNSAPPRKTAQQPAAMQARPKPVAPPVYRPQSVPKVLQRKSAMPARPPAPLGRKGAIQPMLRGASATGGGGGKPPNKPIFTPKIPQQPRKKPKAEQPEQQQQQQQGVNFSDLPAELVNLVGQFAGPSAQNLRQVSTGTNASVVSYPHQHRCCACGGFINPPFPQLCRDCGEPHHRVCPGQGNYLIERYCTSCGFRLLN